MTHTKLFKSKVAKSAHLVSPIEEKPAATEATEFSKDVLESVALATSSSSETTTLTTGDGFLLSPSKDLQLVSKLGSGGMGVVYKAYHKAVEKTLAVKMLHSRLANDSHLVKRFQHEAKAASLMTHVNLASVYDYGLSEIGEPFLVMDYVDGVNLQEVLKAQKSLEIPRFLHIFRQVCDALSHAHMKQLVHRDLKPANIMLVNSDGQPDFVKIVDFGIAKFLPDSTTDEQRLTQTGELLGSPVYMSPEQCLGKMPDARSDIYSLGCVMYEALTGRPPFLRDNIVQTIMGHLGERPAAFSDVAPHRGVTPDLEKLIFRCLEKEPDKRFQSAQDLRDALDLIDQDTSETAKRLITTRLFRSSLSHLLKRHRLIAVIAGCATFVTATAISFGIWCNYEEHELKDAVGAAQFYEYTHDMNRANLSWRKATSLSELLCKPSKTIANLYVRQHMTEADNMKPVHLEKAVEILSRTDSAQVEYIQAMQNLVIFYSSEMNRAQPVAALELLQTTAEKLIGDKNYDAAKLLFEKQQARS